MSDVATTSGAAPAAPAPAAAPPASSPGSAAPARKVMPTYEGFQARLREKTAQHADRLAQAPAPVQRPLPAQRTVQPPAQPMTARERMEHQADRYEARSTDPAAPAPGQHPGQEQPNAEGQGVPDPDALRDPQAEPDAQVAGDELAAAPLDDAAALAKYREWEQTDLLPEDFLDRTRTVKINGLEKDISVREAFQGYMRGGDYRNYYNKVKAHLDESTSMRTRYDEHFKHIEDADAFLDTYERGGYGETLMKVAKKLAERVDNDKMLANGAAIAFAQRHGITDFNDYRVQKAYQDQLARIQEDRAMRVEVQKLKIGYQQLEQQHKQSAHNQQVDAAKTQYAAQLAQLRPNAFRAYGIRDTEGNRKALFRHIDAFVSAHGFPGQFTREMVMTAAQDLRDEQAEERAREKQLDVAPANQNGNRPLPATRLGGGGGQMSRTGPQNARRGAPGAVGSFEQFSKRLNNG